MTKENPIADDQAMKPEPHEVEKLLTLSAAAGRRLNSYT